MSTSPQNQNISLFIKEFRTAFATNPSAFDQQVNKYLALGWTLYGEVVVNEAGFSVSLVKIDPDLLDVTRKVTSLAVQQLNEVFGS